MRKKISILVVDDDRAHRTMLKTLIRKWGYQVFEADDGSVAVEMVEKGPFDLILMDIRMVKVSGLDALKGIKRFNPAIPVIMMTAYSSVETAVQALKEGAYDYLTKPMDFDRLKSIIGRAASHSAMKGGKVELRERIDSGFDRAVIIGRSAVMSELMKTVTQVASSEVTVLIRGESGTGKELVAAAVHYNSPRNKGPFVKINCAAITETLLESELFGHEKGSFTGADRKKRGCFLQADQGSLFMDEVSEMSPTMQAKLLRVLQEREVRPVGSEKTCRIDVRIIAASNKDLSTLVEGGMFREDLFYRLNVLELQIPPLRDRRDDIPLLAQHFLKLFNEKNRKSIKGFTPEAMDSLVRYGWPGNVRELMNAVERGVVLANGDWLDASHFSASACRENQDHPQSPASEEPTAPLEEIEREAILKTLEAASGNKSEAARRLGITRKTLHKKLKSYGM